MKKLLFALIIFSLAAVTAACGNDPASDAAEDGETIRLGYQKGNTMNLLKARGTLDEALNEAGYNVEWREFSMGAPLIEALNTNNIDFGHSSDVHSVLMQSGGIMLIMWPLSHLTQKVLHYWHGKALTLKR